MSSICWIFLFLCLCYINVDGLNFASKLCSYQLFIICHIITHELPTIVELSVQSENFHMKTFIPIYYNNAYLRVQKHSVSVGRWFTMFHSFSVISGDTVKAIQLQCCVRMARLSFNDGRKDTALDCTHLYRSCMQYMKKLYQRVNNKRADESIFQKQHLSSSAKIILHLLFNFPHKNPHSETAS